MEMSSQPELAMPSAQKLEATVPISGHMVHMPGHIYLRVGEYEKAIDINARSQIVDQQFAEVWGDNDLPSIGTYFLNHKVHAPHALDFVRYANTLQGSYEDAYEAATRNAEGVDPAGTRNHKTLAHVWMTDKIFGKWDKIHADNAEISAIAQTPYLKGMWAYVMGSAHVAKGHMGPAEAQVQVIRDAIGADDVNEINVGPTDASHVLSLAMHALMGEIAEANSDMETAILHYGHAVDFQDNLNYTEPPDWNQSIRLYLGAALIDNGQAEEAEEVYLKDLEWNQQNGWSTFGLYQALEAQGKEQEAIIEKRRYESFWRNADVELTRSRI
jgi:tetratricopeptide (TPR) repeat protein